MSVVQKTPRPILEPRPELPWANGAIFNPAAWYDGNEVHLLFRAIPGGYQRVTLSVPDPDGPDTGFDAYVSYIGYASSTDGIQFNVRKDPFMSPDAEFDRYGVEDPRISKLDGTYLITYTALSRAAFDEIDGVRIGLAETTDFTGCRKLGVVGPPKRDKDAVIFPRRIGGRIAMLHRITPNIQLIYFDDLEQLYHPPEQLWMDHLARLEEHVILRSEQDWEVKKVGAGPTPIETPEGWLLIYHGVDANHVYRGGAALLDLDDPRRVIARSRQPILSPEYDFELKGDVDNVVFPEGAVVIDGRLHIYYGAADRSIGHASVALDELLDHLLARKQ